MTMRAEPRPLREVLRYQNRDVVRRFRERYPVSPREAEEVFRETKRWLWLLASVPRSARLAVTTPMLVMDEMWHDFILFTRDYAHFCERYLGQFIGHAPTPERVKQRSAALAERSPERFAEQFAARNRAQYETVLEHLGEDTLRRWYVTYRDKYPPEALLALRRRADEMSVEAFQIIQDDRPAVAMT